MKSARRLLALIICLMFAGMSVMGVRAEADDDLIFEEIEAEPEETVASTEEPTATPTAEPTELPTEAPMEEGDAFPEFTQIPAETAAQQPTAESTAAPEQWIDATPTAPSGQEFCQGYAALPREAVGYDGSDASAKAIYRLVSGVVFVLARDVSAGTDRMWIVFDGGEGELFAWVDASSLRPMSAEEADGFVRARAAAQGTRFYMNAAELPLDVPVYAAIAADVPAGSMCAAEEIAMGTDVLRIGADSLTLGVGESHVLTASFADNQEHSFTYSVENAKVATVTEAGKITGKAAGTTTVFVQSDAGARSVEVTVAKAPSKVSLSAARSTVGAGEIVQLNAALPAGSSSTLTFSTGNEKVATVDANGRVYTLAAGTATLKVTTFNGKTASKKITVKAAPTSISLKDHKLTMGVEQTWAQTATLSKGSAGAYSYESDAPEVVSVDPVTGLLTAHAVGEAEITVTTYNGMTDTCAVTVKDAPSSVRFAKETITIGKGEKIYLPEVVLGEPGEDCAGSYKYSTSSKKYVTVTQTGRIKGVRKGSATITVKTYNGLTAQIKVKVKNAPKKVKVSIARKTLGVDESLVLGATVSSGAASGQLRFVSNKESVAKIETADGVSRVTAVSEGSAKITVYTYNNKKASITVTVKKAPESVEFNEGKIVLGEEQTYAPAITLSSGSAGGCTYVSDAPGIVAVDEASGKMTAVSKGEAQVTVTTYNGKTGSCTVTVKDAPSCVRFAENAIAVGKGEKIYLPAVALGEPGEDCAGSYTYSTSNKKYVTVAQTGAIKGVKAGSATITVKTHNGKTDKVKVTVKKAPSKVTVTAPHTTLGVGEWIDLKTSITSGAASTLSFVSSDSKVAEVYADGSVYAASEGPAKITVTTFNGKFASVKLTVEAAPSGVAIEPAAITVGVGESATLTASPIGGGGGCSFSSDDTDVVSVDAQSGVIKGEGIGTAAVRARTYNDHEAVCMVTVKAAPTGIDFQETGITLSAGDSYQLLPPVLQGEDAVDCAILYKSSSTSYMKVNASGKVTGVKAGTATLTASIYNGLSASIKVNVKAAPAFISFGETARSMLIEDTYMPQVSFSNGVAGTYSLSSSNKAAVVIDEDGKTLRAIGGGSAVITAKSFNGKTAQLTVNVAKLPDSVELQPASLKLGVGECAVLTAVMPEGQGARLTYSSSDSTVASVDADGRVTALAVGSASITVRTQNGRESTCEVRVYGAPTGIALEPEQAELSGGEVLQLKATSLPDGVGAIYFESSDVKIAEVSADGEVTARGAGTCVITATTYDGKHSAQCTLRVITPLSGVRIGIDPGHQGKWNSELEASSPNGGTMKYKASSGTTGVATKIPEYKTNLEISLKLRDALIELGAEVVMTRETHNIDISNQQRAALMNENNVDLALRVHCNGSENQSVNGLEIYTRKTCAYGNDVVDVSQLLANEKRAAEAMFAEIGAATGAKKNKIYYNDNYTMNNWSKVPCLLLELGYMTNPTEDRNLNDPAYQDKIVRGIVNGVCEYMGREKIY